jgi:16S rRNA (uracil1498-N3)-methyltransferase
MVDHISSHRLFIETPLTNGVVYRCLPAQAHYLLNVLRLGKGAILPVFNGVDGEWLAKMHPGNRKKCDLVVLEQTKQQLTGPSIHYLFAPLKKARLDYMVQKATELGVKTMQPVLTRRTNVARIKEERLRANVIEAAEQCGILRLPRILAPRKLGALLSDWQADMPLVFCDEAAPVKSPIEVLSCLRAGAPVAVMIGPEGGFDEHERQQLRDFSFVHALSLGPRIMRADTAGVAALTLINAVLFDWQ